MVEEGGRGDGSERNAASAAAIRCETPSRTGNVNGTAPRVRVLVAPDADFRLDLPAKRDNKIEKAVDRLTKWVVRHDFSMNYCGSAIR